MVETFFRIADVLDLELVVFQILVGALGITHVDDDSLAAGCFDLLLLRCDLSECLAAEASAKVAEKDQKHRSLFG